MFGITHTGRNESISLSFQTSLLVLPVPAPSTLVKWLSHIICAFVVRVLLLDEAGAASTVRAMTRSVSSKVGAFCPGGEIAGWGEST